MSICRSKTFASKLFWFKLKKQKKSTVLTLINNFKSNSRSRISIGPKTPVATERDAAACRVSLFLP